MSYIQQIAAADPSAAVYTANAATQAASSVSSGLFAEILAAQLNSRMLSLASFDDDDDESSGRSSDISDLIMTGAMMEMANAASAQSAQAPAAAQSAGQSATAGIDET